MQPAKLANLENDVVRPGIEKMLVPLALYRGSVSLGRIQAKWNFAIGMMHAEAESFSDGVKLANNEDFPHLCEPVTRLQHMTMQSFFSRLRDHPKITDNIPGLTDYARLVCPHPFGLEKISIYSDYAGAAPWRIFRGPKLQVKGKPSPATLFYPYVVHKPKKEADLAAYDLMVLVNNAVPKGLPDFLRADICQDLVLGVLSGEISKEELTGEVKGYTRKVLQMHPIKYGHLSLDAPLYAGDDRTLLDIIDNSYEAIN